MISLTSPVRTRAHGWPAGPKVAALALATTALFVLPGIWVQLAGLAGMLAAYAAPGRVFLRHGLAQLRVIWLFALMVLAWHGLGGDWAEGLRITLRIVVTLGLANLVTMTTRLTQMTDLLHWALTPLRRIGVPVGFVQAAVPLVIRFLPTLTGKARALMLAWRARSFRRAHWRIVLPIALLALDDSDHLAEALRARGGISPHAED